MALQGNNANRKQLELINEVGGASAHALFPVDMDYYACSLELVNRDNDTVDYFVFPVLYSDYFSSYRSMSSVRKSAGGVLAIKNPGFKPKSIRITGNFGRQFKFMVGQNQVSARAWKFSTGGGDYTGQLLQKKFKSFVVGVKNGYGAIKILEAIIFKASQLDEKGYPYSLYFYNPALGEAYIVNPDMFNITQNMGTNRIWGYQLQMTALGFAGRKDNLWKLLGYRTLAMGMNNAANLAISLIT